MSIRLAVGAAPQTIKALFLRQGLTLTCFGGAIGLISARAVSHWMASLFFGVSSGDLLTYGGLAALIPIAALAASYVLFRRATSLNPIEGCVATEHWRWHCEAQ